MNDYPEYKCEGCALGQCDYHFRLGFEKVIYNAVEKRNMQTGYRYITENCMAKETFEYYDYLEYLYNIDKYGLPWGWLDMPAQLLELVNIYKIEKTYFRNN